MLAVRARGRELACLGIAFLPPTAFLPQLAEVQRPLTLSLPFLECGVAQRTASTSVLLDISIFDYCFLRLLASHPARRSNVHAPWHHRRWTPIRWSP